MLLHEKKLHLIDELLTVDCVKLKLNKNTAMYEENYLRNNIVILLKGEYKLINSTTDGREFVLGIYKDKSILFPSILKGPDFASLFRLEAVTDCTFAIVKYDKCVLVEKFKDDLLEYEDLICQKLYLQMRDLMRTKKLALLSVLIRFSNTYGIKIKNEIKINIKISNLTLAECIGTSPETVSRIISQLKMRKVLDYNSGFYTLKKVDDIKKMLGCSMCRECLCEV